MMSKGYFIDPNTQSVTDWEWDGKSGSLSEKLGCRYYTTIILSDKDVLFIDEEGMFRTDTMHFTIQTYPTPLRGKGIVLGYNPHGDTVSSALSINQVKAMVAFEGEPEFLLKENIGNRYYI
jgi:hypothetical protein